MTDLIAETPIEQPVEASPILPGELSGVALVTTSLIGNPIPNPDVTAQWKNPVSPVLIEGTPEHETFRQELEEFIQSAVRDGREIIAWIRSKL